MDPDNGGDINNQDIGKEGESDGHRGINLENGFSNLIDQIESPILSRPVNFDKGTESQLNPDSRFDSTHVGCDQSNKGVNQGSANRDKTQSEMGKY